MTDWNGVFLRKHFTQIKFVSIEDMSPEDWEILDYLNLRSAATSRIQREALAGRLKGFYRVQVDMHKARVHGGKPVYFWPGTGLQTEDPTQFENLQGYDEEVDPDEDFVREYESLDDLNVSELRGIAIDEGYPAATIQDWPKWALILGIIAKRHEEQDE